jgi:hypothetical protein
VACVACCVVCVACCLACVACCVACVACCVLAVPCCMLHVACCIVMVRVAWRGCMFHVACSMLHRALSRVASYNAYVTSAACCNVQRATGVLAATKALFVERFELRDAVACHVAGPRSRRRHWLCCARGAFLRACACACACARVRVWVSFCAGPFSPIARACVCAALRARV